jgi:hypothetical protein
MSEIVWELPPPPTGGGTRGRKWVELLAPFRARPGRWGRLPGAYSRHMAANISFSGAFEAAARLIDNPTDNVRMCHIYVRYVGDNPEMIPWRREVPLARVHVTAVRDEAPFTVVQLSDGPPARTQITLTPRADCAEPFEVGQTFELTLSRPLRELPTAPPAQLDEGE